MIGTRAAAPILAWIWLSSAALLGCSRAARQPAASSEKSALLATQKAFSVIPLPTARSNSPANGVLPVACPDWGPESAWGVSSPSWLIATIAVVKRGLCARLAKDQARQPTWSVSCVELSTAKEAGTWAITTIHDGSLYNTTQIAHAESNLNAVKTLWIRPPADPVELEREQPGPLMGATMFDFDGDGRAELITQATNGGTGSRTFNTVQIWTVSGAGIVPFGESAQRRLIDISDRNKDGRPEFLADPYRLPLSSAHDTVRPQPGWALLVEVTSSGKLVEDGALARAAALERCPVPDRLLEELRVGRGRCVPAYIHCAKLWNLPPDQIRSALDAFCEQERYDEQPSCPDSRASWQRIVDTQLPFTLTASAGATP